MRSSNFTPVDPASEVNLPEPRESCLHIGSGCFLATHISHIHCMVEWQDALVISPKGAQVVAAGLEVVRVVKSLGEGLAPDVLEFVNLGGDLEIEQRLVLTLRLDACALLDSDSAE